MNMCGTPRVVVVAPWVGTRLDRRKLVMSVFVGKRAATAGEIRVERRVVLIVDVPVAAGRVALPQFNQRMRNRPAVFVEHAPTHDDPFTERRARVLAREVVIVGPDIAMTEQRAGYLGQRLRRNYQRLGRRTLRGGMIRCVEILGLRIDVRPPVDWDCCHDACLLNRATVNSLADGDCATRRYGHYNPLATLPSSKSPTWCEIFCCTCAPSYSRCRAAAQPRRTIPRSPSVWSCRMQRADCRIP